MRQINKLTNRSLQKIFLTGNAGQRIQMKLRYMPTQNLWMMDISLNDFTVNGLNVVVSPNLLRQYRNNIPFGIAVVTDDGQDPYGVDDFDTGYCRMYLMTADEVEGIEIDFYDGQ